MKAGAFLVVAASVLLFGSASSPSNADFICTGSVDPDFFCGQSGNADAVNPQVGGNFDSPPGTEGTLTINGGSVLTSPTPDPNGHIAASVGTTGVVTVTGPGSAWYLSGIYDVEGSGGFLSVGRDGTGTLHVEEGAAVVINDGTSGSTLTDTGLVLGGTGSGLGSGTGIVIVEGTGSIIDISCAFCPDDFGPFATIGQGGIGHMTVQSGGALSLTGGNAHVGVGVGGPPSGVADPLGTLDVLDGGTVTVDGLTGAAGMQIGQRDGSKGEATVSNSTLTITGNDVFMAVGRGGDGSLDVLAGGSVTLDSDGHANLTLGRDPNSSGDVTIAEDSQLLVSGQDARIFVGREGNGNLQILSNSSVVVQGLATDAEDTGIQIAHDENGGDGRSGTGSITVDNASLSVSSINAFINVGTEGAGTLTARNGATVDVTGSTGFGFLGVGRNENAKGELNVESGAQVSVTSGSGDSSTFVAEGIGSVGTVIVDGAGSKLNAGETLGIGIDFDLQTAGGTGTVNVKNGGEVIAGEIHVGENGFLGGNGSVTGNIVNHGGTLGAGLSPGTLNIFGDITQETGTFEVEMAGLAPGQFDVFNVDGTVNFLGGSILFIFLDGFLPQANDIVNFLVADEILGLSNITFQYQGAAPGFEFNVLDTGSGLQFLARNDAIAVPEPATFALFGAGLLGLSLLSRRRSRS